MHERGTVQQAACSLGPVRRRENDVAVQPRNLAAIRRQRLQRHVQQPLFLPKNRATAQPDQDICVTVLQLETIRIAQFDRNKRHVQALAKNPVV